MIASLLRDLVLAYEREVNPASDWRDTALTEDEFMKATAEYRAAKQWLADNDRLSFGRPQTDQEKPTLSTTAPA